jgi:hypothetical protein
LTGEGEGGAGGGADTDWREDRCSSWAARSRRSLAARASADVMSERTAAGSVAFFDAAPLRNQPVFSLVAPSPSRNRGNGMICGAFDPHIAWSRALTSSCAFASSASLMTTTSGTSRLITTTAAYTDVTITSLVSGTSGKTRRRISA